MPKIERKIARGILRSGIFHFAAKVADVVVAEVAIDCLYGGVAEAGEKNPGKTPGAGGIGEYEVLVEVSCPAVDEPGDCGGGDDPENRGDFADGGDAAIEEHDGDHDQENRDEAIVVCEREHELARLCAEPGVYCCHFCGEVERIIRESERAGGNAERALKERLPDEEERHEAAEAIWSVGFAQKHVAAAGLRHCGAEFRPDATVHEREGGANDPGEDALRAVHGANDERDDDERADADHERHVERGGFEEVETAFEFFGFGHFVAM